MYTLHKYEVREEKRGWSLLAHYVHENPYLFASRIERVDFVEVEPPSCFCVGRAPVVLRAEPVQRAEPAQSDLWRRKGIMTEQEMLNWLHGSY